MKNYLKPLGREMLPPCISRSLFPWSYLMAMVIVLFGCKNEGIEGAYQFSLQFEEGEEVVGTMIVEKQKGTYQISLRSFEYGKIELEDLQVSGNHIVGGFEKWEMEWQLEVFFSRNEFTGNMSIGDESMPFKAVKQSEEPISIDRSGFEYLLPAEDLPETEKNLDHAEIIASLDQEAFERGHQIYNSSCTICHGTPDTEGSIPQSNKFWKAQPYKAGSDFYSMYLSLTRGIGSMPPQLTLTPREKYEVIHYVQFNYLREHNEEAYIEPSPDYLAGLPKGTSLGPEPKPYHPWSDMDYGNFFINTYELVDAATGPARDHSPGPIPFVDEDYSKNNFAYKGIAVRLDQGEGGVSKGNTWMIFDHDIMRVAGGWTGEGFIDWDGILLNDAHETYPRTIGKLHFETPVGPGWANPSTGSFEDPRWQARDGRSFGPLPKSWSDYKGLYHHGENIIISYSVGQSNILERLGLEYHGKDTVFTRTLNVSPSTSILKMRIAPVKNKVAVSGNDLRLSQEEGYHILNINKSSRAKVKVFIAGSAAEDLQSFASKSGPPESLEKYTQGGPPHYPEELSSLIIRGKEDGVFAVDELTPPFENPWEARMKLSGIDFMKDANVAIACTTDGDIWKITGLIDGQRTLKWKRIGAGLFQPLGIKILEDKIYVICRDQLVWLRDFNGDGETDFYESFNHDHQVTDHFHEFAMGLQADEKGNLYYAKSGRHAREALVPQHGTLIKVSADGSQSEIIATGFRAANGVCINPDGSFIVTDQQGYWNPMNRINWVEVDGKEKFYGNMWGFNPPKDTTREAMEPPMIWVDMEWDRSPSELLWVESKKWGPLNGSLLSFSYGYGKIQLVLNEKVNGQMQGGIVDLPGIKFLTGVMRGRFNPIDEHLYVCGMSAWGTSQLMRGGGLYRIRYTGNPLPLPIELKAVQSRLVLRFDHALDPDKAQDIDNYEIKTWNLLRSSAYGSDRFDRKKLKISKAQISSDAKIVHLFINKIQPVDVMSISYTIEDKQGNPVEGHIQNTIHNLREDGQLSLLDN